MQKRKIVKPFRGSPDGARVFDYETGDIVPSLDKPWSEDLDRVALQNKWARKHNPSVTGEKKTDSSAQAAASRVENAASSEPEKAADSQIDAAG